MTLGVVTKSVPGTQGPPVVPTTTGISPKTISQTKARPDTNTETTGSQTQTRFQSDTEPTPLAMTLGVVTKSVPGTQGPPVVPTTTGNSPKTISQTKARPDTNTETTGSQTQTRFQTDTEPTPIAMTPRGVTQSVPATTTGTQGRVVPITCPPAVAMTQFWGGTLVSAMITSCVCLLVMRYVLFV